MQRRFRLGTDGDLSHEEATKMVMDLVRKYHRKGLVTTGYVQDEGKTKPYTLYAVIYTRRARPSDYPIPAHPER
jgi:hypothetical protein